MAENEEKERDRKRGKRKTGGGGCCRLSFRINSTLRSWAH